MGHKNKESLTRQIEKEYKSMIAFGESKHEAKRSDEGIKDKIYSRSTLKSYMAHANYFAEYCKENFNCKTLEQCRSHVDDWLRYREEQGMSAYTLKLEASSLAKLYHCSTKDFVQTKARSRSDITRSRNEVENDKHFNEEKHKDFVDFCRSCGLRREELEHLKGWQLRENFYGDGKDYIYIGKDDGPKGGRSRLVPIIGNVEHVKHLMKEAGPERVFEKVPSHADIHSYRSDYATKMYNDLARDIKDIPYDKVNKGTGRKYQGDVYHCRGDYKGIKLDKLAMKEVSNALGHERLEVVAGHYIRL